MKKISTDQLEPGMQLSRPALSDSGATLLEAGTLLNREYIDKLQDHGIGYVYIIDTSTRDELLEKQEILLTKEFSDTHRRAINSTKLFIEKIAAGSPPDREEIEAPVVDLMEKLLINKDILFKLTGIYSMDNYLYSHSVNTSVLAMLIGLSQEYDRADLIDLGASALLADIGMSLIPRNIYEHSGPLSEEQRDIIKKHPEHGVTILERVPQVKDPVLEAVYQHHERYDGSGYPFSIDGDRISRFAKIIAVADVYAAIREPRAHREKSPPRRALKKLTGDQGFDPSVLRSLFATISVYPVQSIVRLSNGCIGAVVRVTENNPFRPTVKLLRDETGRPISSPIRIDLTSATNQSLFIEDALDRLPGDFSA